MKHLTPLAAVSPVYLETLLERYRQDPASVPEDWRAYLTGFLDAAGELPAPPAAEPREEKSDTAGAVRIRDLYRRWGHRAARLDPLDLVPPEMPPELFDATVRDAVEAAHWQEIYCATAGYEFEHVEDRAEREWLFASVEEADRSADPAEHRRRAERLIEADEFEQFMMRRFPGTKRFSGEGVDSQITLIDALFERAVQQGIAKTVIAPVHRGRLQLMHNVFGKPLAAIFAELGGFSAFPDGLGIAGDVTYHLGTTTDLTIDGTRFKVEMISNPSHLEAIDPVVAGLARATQDGRDIRSVLPLMFHTDAAVIGQGVVSEVQQLAGVSGFAIGGTVHVVINNQIGFTTAVGDARTSRYCTDVAKAIGAPVVHVNADDPDAAARTAKLAIDYRQRFGKDIYIDLIGYRRLGHNELDEPRFTQPGMYAAIDRQESVRLQYCRAAIAAGAATEPDLIAYAERYRKRLDAGFEGAKTHKTNVADQFVGRWSGLRAVREAGMLAPSDTGVATETLRDLGRRICTLPDGLVPDEKVGRFLDARRSSIELGDGLNWSTAEALAWASLLAEGTSVRLTGEDSARGTFTQRHGRILDRGDGHAHVPFEALAADGARFELYDSPLSEYAVLGFELGYSWGEPSALVQWEAQFGDFANGAQIIIDQFLSAGEDKWLRSSGLVMLLPHGLEGGGPEHSSARLERFLALCAKGNLQVVNCTSPANHFHTLRRQVRRDFRKPLIAMTPKSLLRHKAAVSRLADMATGTGFRPILPDPSPPVARRRIVLCSGKIYYDLAAERETRGVQDIALVRLEQLYPFPAAALAEILQGAPDAEIFWCQEEPENMGAWRFVEPRIARILARIKHRQRRAGYVGRAASPSPAPGLADDYRTQQAGIVAGALKS